MNSFALKGDICYSLSATELHTIENGYLVCVDGMSKGAFQSLPECYHSLPLIDHSGLLILPGLVDLHMHAPQYTYRALGMDLELLDWLNTYTFPEESRYKTLDYARPAYQKLVADLMKSPNTRICLFATVHVPATELLMDLLENSGLVTMVGKVNMDRNASDAIVEESAEASLRATRQWLNGVNGRYQRTSPILTPRFIPSCTDALSRGLGEIKRETGLPLQSHLSENLSEIEWVRTLCPQCASYTDAYALFGEMDEGSRTIMAHCVWTSEEELELLKQRGVFIAHCPQSNANIASGIAPIRRYLDHGLSIGLGSDIAGGCHPSIFRAMTDAIQFSKLRWRLVDSSLAPLSLLEAFYFGTLGGGAFFGKVGSFLSGYEFDALVIDDNRLKTPCVNGIEDRLARAIYLSDDRDIVEKYVRGTALQ